MQSRRGEALLALFHEGGKAAPRPSRAYTADCGTGPPKPFDSERSLVRWSYRWLANTRAPPSLASPLAFTRKREPS
jgi:hypothetical protein